MKDILCNLTDSESMFLFNEQYVVKPSKSKNTAFRWHQDAEYLPEPRLYISVWIPIDGIVPENGSIFMVPYDHSLDIRLWKEPSLSLGEREIAELQNETVIITENDDREAIESENISTENVKNEEVDEGTLESKTTGTLESKKLELLPAVGDMVIFSSYTFHKSNSNQSNAIRRVMMTQYSTFPIIDRMNKKLARLVVKM